MTQPLLFIHPQEPEKSFLHSYGQDSFDFKEWTIESIVEEIEKEKDCNLEFTDFFGRQIPKGSTEEYFRALQPFYITKMSDIYQVFVRGFRGETITLKTDSQETILQLKAQIQERTRIAVEMQRLEYEGKQLEDGRTLADYNIHRHYTLNLNSRLRGGSFGKEFVDITNEEKAKIQQWSKTAPDWRTANPGLVLEGKCLNQSCRAFRQWVVINKGMTTYDQVYNEHENECPMCSSYVKVEKCGFNNCLYGYTGIKLGANGKKPHKVTSQKEIKVGDHYKLFDPEIAGKAIWSTLKIVTKELKKGDDVKGVTCGICQKEIKGKEEKLECSHMFHEECFQKMKKIIPLCSYCHF